MITSVEQKSSRKKADHLSSRSVLEKYTFDCGTYNSKANGGKNCIKISSINNNNHSNFVKGTNHNSGRNISLINEIALEMF